MPKKEKCKQCNAQTAGWSHMQCRPPQNAPMHQITNAPEAVVHQSTRAAVHQCTRGTIVNCLFGEMRSLQAACARKAAPAPAYFDVRNSALEPSHILCI